MYVQVEGWPYMGVCIDDLGVGKHGLTVTQVAAWAGEGDELVVGAWRLEDKPWRSEHDVICLYGKRQEAVLHGVARAAWPAPLDGATIAHFLRVYWDCCDLPYPHGRWLPH